MDLTVDDVTIEELDSTNRRMTFAIAAQEVKEPLRNRISQYSKKVSLPGFRKGKVPYSIVEKRFGENILNELIAELAAECMRSTLTEDDQQPIGRPVIEQYQVNEETSDYDVSIKYEVFPEVTVTGLAGCKTVRSKVTVTEQDVDLEIESWFKNFPQWEVAEKAATGEDRVWADVDSVQHATRQTDSNKEVCINLTSDPTDAALKNACIGKKEGDRFSVDQYEKVEADSGETSQDPVGEPNKLATFHVLVKRVEQRIPDSIHADILSEIGVDSPQDENFREKTKEQMEKEAARITADQTNQHAITLLIDRNPFVVPEALVNESIYNSFRARGVSNEDFMSMMKENRYSLEWLDTYVRTAAELKRDIILSKLLEIHNLQVDEEAVGAQTQSFLENNPSLLENNSELDSDYGKGQPGSPYEMVSSSVRRNNEQHNIMHLMEKLLSESDCEEMEMSLQEFKQWSAEFNPLTYQEPETDSEQSGDGPETSLILDASGNPIDKTA